MPADHRLEVCVEPAPGVLKSREGGEEPFGVLLGVEQASAYGGGSDDAGGDRDGFLDPSDPVKMRCDGRPGEGAVGLKVPTRQGLLEAGDLRAAGVLGALTMLADHEPHPVAGSGKHAYELLPAVHRVAALCKRWLLGTHQGPCRRRAHAVLHGSSFELIGNLRHVRGNP